MAQSALSLGSLQGSAQAALIGGQNLIYLNIFKAKYTILKTKWW